MIGEIVDSLSRLTTAERQSLVSSTGVASSPERLALLEADRRLETKYVVVRGGSELVAVAPMYRPRSGRWQRPGYAPPSGLDPAEFRPVDHWYLGGIADFRACVLAPDGNQHSPDAIQTLLATATSLAVGSETKRILFPYFYTADQRKLAAADRTIVWSGGLEEARLDPLLEEEKLGSGARAQLRRDRRRAESLQVVSDVCDWNSAAVAASNSIAEHSLRLEQPDHADLVRLRMADWQRCENIRALAFTATDPEGHVGYLSALLWNQELDLYEVGLPAGGERHAIYLELLFHAPLRFARKHNVRRIRCGTEAGRPKRLRGAELLPLHFGQLNLVNSMP